MFLHELTAVIGRSVNDIDAEFLPQSFHRLNCAQTHLRVQQAVDRVDESRHQAVLLAYGFCNKGLLGLKARGVPLVMPRAEDCTTLLREKNQRYRGYLHDHPRMHVRRCPQTLSPDSVGIRRLVIPPPPGAASHPRPAFEPGMGAGFPADDSRDAGPSAFCQGCRGSADHLMREAIEEAAWFGWDFDRAPANLDLFQRFVDGFWSHHEFLVVPPGWHTTRCGAELVAAEEARA